MKTKYLVMGLDEKSICEDVGLSSIGLTTYTKHFVLGTLIDTTYSQHVAAKIAKDNCDKYELGIEIKTIFVKD